MIKHSKDNIPYVVAKLEEIHADVTQLKQHVDELRQVEAGRKANQKLLTASVSVLGGIVAWISTIVLGLK